MKIATCLMTLVVCVPMTYAELVEVPFGTSSTASPSGLLNRPDSAPADFSSVSDKHTHRVYSFANTRFPTAELATWGWFEGELDQDVSANFDDNSLESKNKIGAALTDLGLSTTPMKDGGKNIAFAVEHHDDQLKYDDGQDVPIEEQNYEIDGKLYPNTGAGFIFAFNPEQGGESLTILLRDLLYRLIFGQNFLGPKAAAEHNLPWDPKKEEFPKLSMASDILAAYWLRNPNPKNLKYWFGQDVVNEATEPIIMKILVDHGYTEGVPAWPGLQLDMPSDEALALLGSPIGSTVAFFLIQHKEELGLKRVTSVTIFRDHNTISHLTAEVQLLFRIDDVPKDDILPEDTEMLGEGTTEKRTRRSVRKDSMVDPNLGRSVSRMHEMTLDERGETVLHSHDLKREL
ncbi:hypothetical protein ACET3X_003808 [Alternaria dauci]|uniref:Uncharacterized protein n=1 Tax=Alternaria dauci TaxID=48095 RepID=A0ABR3ULV1_9PLEO